MIRIMFIDKAESDFQDEYETVDSGIWVKFLDKEDTNIHRLFIPYSSIFIIMEFKND